MDDQRFDAISRSLGTARSRRGLLALLGGAVGLALDEAGARRRKRGRNDDAIHPAGVSTVCAAAGGVACNPEQVKPGAILKDCHFVYSDFSGRKINAANLTRANFTYANLRGASLAGANLADACLELADLTGARLNGANLKGADLTGADLSGTDLRGSNVKPAQLAAALVTCTTLLPNGRAGTCPPGTACIDGDCVTQQGTCPTGEDLCPDLLSFECNGDRFCSCFTSTEGSTRCANNSDFGGTGSCGQCRSSADCEASFPDIPGVFCVRTAGTLCCDGDSFGFCLAPCPTIL